VRGRFALHALVAANAISLCGNVLAVVAVPWFVLETTGSPAKTGIAAFFTTLPLAFGALFGGTVADRLGHRTASIATDVVSGCAIAAVPILFGLGRLDFWLLAALVFATSLFDAPGQSAREALVPDLAERSGLPLERATSLWVSTEHVAYVVGAPLAGVLIAWIGATDVLWLDAGSFFLAALVVAVGVDRPRTAPARTKRYLDELREGVRFISTEPVLRLFLVSASIGNMLAAPIALVVLPVYAKEVVGSSTALGLCVAAYGIGGIASAVLLGPVVRRLGRARGYLVGWSIWRLIYFGIALLPPLPIMICILLATGLSGAAPVEALVRQERTPAELRARVFATQTAALTLAAPVGVIGAGLMIEVIGLQAAVFVLATLNVLGTVGFVRAAARGLQAATSAA
jgi:MFS family permease